MHRDFAILLIDHLEGMGHSTPDQAIIHEIITEAVDIEREFITESLSCNLIGMNAELMAQYIQFVADHLAVSLGVDKIYGVQNSFDWMETISLITKGKSLTLTLNPTHLTLNLTHNSKPLTHR
jgi:ribonucleoside-diphosphate reductase subunit M2